VIWRFNHGQAPRHRLGRCKSRPPAGDRARVLQQPRTRRETAAGAAVPGHPDRFRDRLDDDHDRARGRGARLPQHQQRRQEQDVPEVYQADRAAHPCRQDADLPLLRTEQAAQSQGTDTSEPRRALQTALGLHRRQDIDARRAADLSRLEARRRHAVRHPRAAGREPAHLISAGLRETPTAVRRVLLPRREDAAGGGRPAQPRNV